MDRKVVKRAVMTIPYNAKAFSNRDYIREALEEKGVEISKDDLTATVKAVRDSMDVIVPGPMAVMSWIESEVSKAIVLVLLNFSGLHHQALLSLRNLNKKLIEVIQLQLLGSA